METAIIVIIVFLLVLALLHTINQIFVIKNKITNIEKINAEILKELKAINKK